MSDTPESATALREQIRHLEDQARLTLDVLDMATGLADFQAHMNRKATPTQVLHETHARLGDLIPFAATAFLLVDEHTSDFKRAVCLPEDKAGFVDDEVLHLIESGLFALAVRENRPITVYSRDGQHRLVLCVLATTTRVRGMFVGVQPRTARNVSAVLLSLLRLVLRQCANAIESHERETMRHAHEEMGNALIDGLGLPVFETDAAGGFRHMNPEARLLVARVAPKGDAGLLDVVHTDERPALAEAIGVAMQHLHPLAQLCRLVVDVGGCTHALLHLTPVAGPVRCIGLRGIIFPHPFLATIPPHC